MNSIPPKEFKTVSREPIQKLLRPFIEFTDAEASGGIILVICIVVALVWINSSISNTYTDLWHTEVGIQIGILSLSKYLTFWINEGLMTLFFFFVGLEIKREILIGELNKPQQALLPILAALGGMILPALIYIIFNPPSSEGFQGWAIPMATDIAFALGVLALLGNHVPFRMKIFLTTLAIVDDIGSIVMIAVFYTKLLQLNYLLWAVIILMLLIVINRLNIRNNIPYIILGILLWLFLYEGGIHPTIAGILLALTIPATKAIDFETFTTQIKGIINRFESPGPSSSESKNQYTIKMSAIQSLEYNCERLQAPLQILEHRMTFLVVFIIVPLFVLANAGVVIDLSTINAVMSSSIAIGVILGLLIGKPLGIVAGVYIGNKTGIVDIPKDIKLAHILGIGYLGGIGFTMSHFIAGLAFEGTKFLPLTKISILLASGSSAIIGFALLWQLFRKERHKGSHLSGISQKEHE